MSYLYIIHSCTFKVHLIGFDQLLLTYLVESGAQKTKEGAVNFNLSM